MTDCVLLNIDEDALFVPFYWEENKYDWVTVTQADEKRSGRSDIAKMIRLISGAALIAASMLPEE